MINLCIITNSRFVIQTLIFLDSLFKNNTKDSFKIYLLYAELADDEIKKIEEFVNKCGSILVKIKVEEDKYDFLKDENGIYSREVYYKILLPKLIPINVKRILYCDVDEIITNEIKSLYDMDLDNNKIAAVADFFINKFNLKHKKRLGLEKNNYFNSGVVLFDLEKIRLEYDFELIKKIVRMNKANIVYPDQDILNILFSEQTYFLDEKNNYITKIRGFVDFIRYLKNKKQKKLPTILHYAGIKPLNPVYDGKYYDEYWKYARNIVDLKQYNQINKQRKIQFLFIWIRRFYRFIFHVRRF